MKLLITILLLLQVQIALSQFDHSFNRISKDDGLGLASNIIHCTYQDKRGYIWVGTANGLQRFDGSKFIWFSSSRPQAGTLPQTEISSIVPHSDNALWLLLKSFKKVGILNTSSFKFTEVPIISNKQLPAGNNIQLLKDERNNVFLFIWKYGVLRYDSTRKAFVEDNFFRLPKNWIPSLYVHEDKQTKRFWLPCPDSGLVVYDYTTKQSYTAQHNPLNIPLLNKPALQKNIWEVYIDQKRRHWIFRWAPNHIYNCFNENGQPLTDTAGLTANTKYNEVRHFFESKNKVLWLYGMNALITYNKDETVAKYFDKERALKARIEFRNINHIMEDNDGIVWVSTDNGLFYNSPAASNMDAANIYFLNKQNEVDITDLIQLKGGQYWLSTWGNGIITLDKRFNKYNAEIYKQWKYGENKNGFDQCWSLLQDHTGKVWIGCQKGQYMLYDTTTKKTSFNTLLEAEGATIRYLVEDKLNNIWIGTQRGHIIKYDGKTFTVVQRLNTVIKKILVDNNNTIWLTAEGKGVFRLRNNGSIIQHYTQNLPINKKLYSDYCEDLEQINDSTIITGGGALNFINIKTGLIDWITVEEGLPSNTVKRLRKDKRGHLWINTADGLCRYNPASKSITTYGKKDGIEFEQFTTTADYLCNEGFIMFAGTSHLVFFKPSAFEDAKTPPNVTITDFKLLNAYIPADSLTQLPTTRLHYDQNSFTINFSALSFLQREKLVYYYKMDGIDNDWIKTDKQLQVSYSLLPPGKYSFHVYCENIDGVRSNAITTLNVYITPPFWKTKWFISTLLTIILLVAYGMHQLQIFRILAVEKIRNRVARDLHDDMGSTLSTINILSSMAKAKLNSDQQKTGEYLNKISDNSQRMMEAMDDIVWAIKPANDGMGKIIARMREFATSVLEAKDIDLQFTVAESVNNIQLNMEARRDFFLLFKEAVNNVAKYAKCATTNIQLYIRNNQLHLIVSDNGIGFEIKTADSGNGLGNMQKRADALQAKLIINSEISKGTSVHLITPIK